MHDDDCEVEELGYGMITAMVTLMSMYVRSKDATACKN
jgi:hypothetical protein